MSRSAENYGSVPDGSGNRTIPGRDNPGAPAPSLYMVDIGAISTSLNLRPEVLMAKMRREVAQVPPGSLASTHVPAERRESIGTMAQQRANRRSFLSRQDSVSSTRVMLIPRPEVSSYIDGVGSLGSVGLPVHMQSFQSAFTTSRESDSLLRRQETGTAWAPIDVAQARRGSILSAGLRSVQSPHPLGGAQPSEEMILTLPSEAIQQVAQATRPMGLLVPTDTAPDDPFLLVLPTDTEPAKKEGRLPALPSLPSRLEGAELFLAEQETGGRADVMVRLRLSVQWLGYALVLLAVLAVSSLGVASKSISQAHVTETMVGLWRAEATSMCLLPLCLVQMLGVSKSEWEHILRWKTLVWVTATSLGYFFWLATFFYSLQMTTVTHAFLLNNAHSVVLVVGKAMMGHSVQRLEAVGTFIAALGIAGTIVGKSMGMAQDQMTTVLIGDIISFSGAIGAVAYIIYGKRLRDNVPLFMYMFPVQLSAALLSMLQVALTEQGTTWGTHTVHGIFGWMTTQWVWHGLYLGVVTGVMGAITYIAALRMVPPIVVSVAMLLEPVFGSAMSVVAGYDTLDMWTVGGGMVMLAGTALVTYATRTKEVVRNVNEFVKEVPATQPVDDKDKRD